MDNRIILLDNLLTKLEKCRDQEDELNKNIHRLSAELMDLIKDQKFNVTELLDNKGYSLPESVVRKLLMIEKEERNTN